MRKNETKKFKSNIKHSIQNILPRRNYYEPEKDAIKNSNIYRKCELFSWLLIFNFKIYHCIDFDINLF